MDAFTSTTCGLNLLACGDYRGAPLSLTLYYSEDFAFVALEEIWESRSEIATVFSAVIAFFSFIIAISSYRLAGKSLKISNEAKEIAKHELEAKKDDFEINWIDTEQIIENGLSLVAIYVELINKSSVSNSLVKFNINAHLHFSDDSEQKIEIEEYRNKGLSTNIWDDASQIFFPLLFNERQAQKGYIVVRIPSLVTKSDYIKKLTLNLTSSQNKIYSIDCYGL